MNTTSNNIDKKALISEAFNQLKSVNLKYLNVINSANEVIGTVALSDIAKAIDFDLGSKPVSLITNYIEEKDLSPKTIDKAEIQKKIDEILPESIKEAIAICSKLAEKKGVSVYIVGGIVRDLIRNAQNLDLDITMESQGIEFAEHLEKEFDSVTLKEVHKDFGTAKITIKTSTQDVEVDIASTRKEYYKYPGALPTISDYCCDLKDDLQRRDFTINAMAININPENYCEITDNLCGLNDISNETLRIIHPLSFIDDPTRIIRGIEFAVRFNYKFSKATELLIIETINSNLFDGFGTERLKLELKPALNLNSIEVIEYLAKYNIATMIDPEIKVQSLADFRELNSNINVFINHINKDHLWLIYLACIICNLPKTKISSVLDKLYLTNLEKTIILEGVGLISDSEKINKAMKPSEIYKIFINKPFESLIVSTFRNYSDITDKIKLFTEQYSKINTYTTGTTLIDLGFKPGPVFSEILNKLLELKIDGKITDQAEEMDYIKKNYLDRN